MKGLSQSDSDSMEPVARNRDRWGARSKPFLIVSEPIDLSLKVIPRPMKLQTLKLTAPSSVAKARSRGGAFRLATLEGAVSFSVCSFIGVGITFKLRSMRSDTIKKGFER